MAAGQGGRGRGMTATRIERLLVDRLAEAIGRSADTIDVHATFAEHGLGSKEVVALTGVLEDVLGRKLDPTLAFEHPTPHLLARHLAGERTPRPAAVAAPAHDEPIAIVGIACRFPGAADPAAFWRLVRDGVDAVGEVPAGRWDAARLAHAPAARFGGFVADVDRFDRAFFGIAPREAARMDPQHRLLLEVAWEAFEDAGIPPDRLTGGATGVFVGISSGDYLLAVEAAADLDGHLLTGNSHSIAANRISYTLGLTGPSLAVDTACSSSLTAVHLACQSLCSGECELAIAGGVNVLCAPEVAAGFAQLGALAPDGRCKAFDARADGIGRGEGAGIVVLKPLGRARADGDRIHAVILGSALNNDGRTNGLTAPSRGAQEAVLRAAYRRAGVAPGTVEYVEAHGTGTALGDPIEALALATVLAEGRPPERPCAIGSVKTNVGHLEAAAGIAGLIKVVLALVHETLPASLHFAQPNPLIPFDRVPLRVQTATGPWPRQGRAEDAPALAGVSAFGFGGTNVHVVVAGAPPVVRPEGYAPSVQLVPLSARAPAALCALAGAVGRVAGALPDVAHAASTRRSHHGHRLAVVASSRETLAAALDAFVAGAPHDAIVRGVVANAGPPRIVWVFSGQGGGWTGMGRGLLATEPAFRAMVERVDAWLARHADWSLAAELAAEPARSRLGESEVAQVTIVALQLALAAVWRSWGIVPDGVAGHSLGEIAAAAVADAFEPEDALAVALARGRLMQRAVGHGAMAAVGLSAAEAERAVAAVADRVALAAINGPRATVLSGDPQALEDVLAGLRARDVFCRPISTNGVAGHCPQMDRIAAELERALAGLRPRPAALPFVSTVTGGCLAGTSLDAAYWARNVRARVELAAALDVLLGDGPTLVLEIGPHPVLAPVLREAVARRAPGGGVLPSLERDADERTVMLRSLGALWTRGCRVDWDTLHPGGGRPVSLPLYPWQRERCWLAPSPKRDARTAAGGHPLLGRRLRAAAPPLRDHWQADVGLDTHPYLADHRVHGVALLPASAYVEMAAAAVAAAPESSIVIEDLRFHRPLVLPEEGARTLQLVAEPAGGATAVRVFVADAAREDAWTLAASGTARAECDSGDQRGVTLASEPADVVRRRCAEGRTAEALYAALAARGLEYGPCFRGVTRVWRRDGESLVELAAPSEVRATAGHRIHPAVLDAAFHAVAAAMAPPASADDDLELLPAAIERVRLLGSAAAALTAHATIRAAGDTRVVADLRIADASGQPVALIDGLTLERPRVRISSTYALTWVPPPSAGEPSALPARVLVLGDRGGTGRALAQALAAAGVDVGFALDGDAGVARAAGERWDAVVCTAALDTPEPERAAPDAAHLCGRVALLVRSLAAAGSSAALWLLTRGAQAVSEADAVAVAQAPLWGLGRVIAVEHPELRPVLVDLDPAGARADDARAVVAAMRVAGGETQLALRGGVRLVARLVRTRPTGDEPPSLRADGTYLVTGGLGGLGLAVAGWLAARGARHLVLVGRSGAATDDARRAVAMLRDRGVEVGVACADVADGDAVARLLAEHAGPPLRGVVHAAGVLADGLLVHQDDGDLARVLAPKVAGAWHLHRATAGAPLELFVAFSSAAAIVGSPGQASYAAANAFLDALAAHRRTRGLPAQSIAWGPWATIGAATTAVRSEQMARFGLSALPPADALALLDAVVAGDRPHTMVAAIDWAALARALPGRRVPPVLSRLASPVPDAAGGVDRAALVALAEPDRTARLETLLRHELGGVLGLAPEERLERDRSLATVGLDSIMALEVKHRLEAGLGIVLPLARIASGPSIAELARELARQLDVAGDGAPFAVAPPGAWGDERQPSRGHEALWFVHRLAPESAAYNVPQAFRLRGRLDLDALRRALAAVVGRHAQLRSTFSVRDGRLRQRISERLDDWLVVEDATAWSAAALEARLAAEAHRPFDLERGPLLRVHVLTRSPAEHVVVFVAHHVVLDLWSLEILLTELLALYEAESSGAAPALPPLAADYGDFVRWQAEMLAGPAGAEHWAYWQRTLASEPAVLDLPLDRPRPAQRSGAGDGIPFALDGTLTAGLRRLARRQGATLYTTLLAVFDVLLHRYSGQSDVLVCSPTTGRSHEAVAGIVGYFVNLVPLRADLAGDPSFAAFLARIRGTVLDATAHQDLPYPLLVERLCPVRDPSRPPLCQALFVLQQSHLGEGVARLPYAPGAALERAGLSVEAVAIAHRIAQFELALSLGETADGLGGVLEYDSALFDAATVERMVRHFRTLAGAVVATPECRLSALPLVPPDERQALIALGPGAPGARVEPGFPARFAAQVARTPDAVALVCGRERLTYAALDAQANRLAHHLRSCGVGAETVVALALRDRLRMVVGLLAVMKAGGAYLPLDPGAPDAHLAFVLTDAAPRVLVVAGAPRGALARTSARVVSLDGDGAAIAACPPTPLDAVPDPDGLAYVIYTSGSTGRPKGTLVTHRGLVNLAEAQRDHFGDALGAGAVVLQFASPTFDGAVWEMLLALAHGGALSLLDGETLLPGPELVALLRAEGVTIATLPPSVLAALPAEALPALRTVVAAGERCPGEIVARWAAGRRVWNGYGPTENTVCATLHACSDAVDGAPPIGAPIRGVEAHVLDRHGEPVPAGVPGELCLGGVALARGYLGRPDLTAERFVPHPFAPAAGARLYRTGDRVRRRADGVLEFLGRIDDQVKLRGFRIEPAEIEAVLRRQPGVGDAVVVLREDLACGRGLVAYVTGSTAPDAGVLRAAVARALPPHMVPAAYVRLAALPLSPHGKVDRRALPAPALPAHVARTPPRTPAEVAVAAVWRELLGVDEVGVDDDFFALGGHSLLATELVFRLHERLGLELSLRAFLAEPTVGALAGAADAAAVDAPGRGALPAIARRAGSEARLSFAQERLWFLDRLDEASATYNAPLVLRLDGALDAGVLARVLDALVERHEALRTCFVLGPQGPRQRIVRHVRVRLERVDVGALAPEARAPEALRIARREAARPFDLERAPLLRATLVRVADDAHVLVLVLHHIVCDGWSLALLAREASTLYAAFVAGGSSPLAALDVQYADYAEWQRDVLAGEGLACELAYWRERLAEPVVLALPTDRPRPPVQTFRGDTVRFELPGALLARLEAIARGEQATLFMALLALFDVLLARSADQDDVCVGVPVAGRERPEIAPLIGFFVNTLVLRTSLAGAPSFRTLLARVRETALGAYAHQAAPFELVVDAVAPARDLARPPLFQAMFVFQNVPMPPLELGGLRLTPLAVGTGTAKFDLTLHLVPSAAGLDGVLEYNSDLFEAATAARMVRHFERLAAAAVAHPDRPVTVLPLLDDAERRALIEGGHGPAVDVGAAAVHELVAAAAARTPDAIAVEHGDTRLTNGELQVRANQLAHALRARGVGPDTIVGVCLSRSPELIVALLGVLAAGGAYLPLDPAHPDARFASLLADAGARLVVTEARLAERLPAGGPEQLVLAAAADELATQPSSAPDVAVHPEQLAYVIYTSGSSGQPKGVMVSHGGLASYVRWSVAAYDVAAGRGTLLHSSIAFDLTVTALFPALVAGRTVVVVPDDAGVEALGAMLVGRDASLVKLTPSHLDLLAAQMAPAEVAGCTRRLVVGGEALDATQLRFWRRHAPATRIVNEYGPTETVVGCAVHTLGPDAPETGPVPIGAPIANARLYVLDRHLEPVPPGVAGELYIGGAGVARGYLDRPATTAERFVPDPFALAPGGRLYRSGDRARRRADGLLEYLGRADEQVKLRGFRVEPGEVVAALRRQAGVEDAAVVVREERAGHPALVAYVAGPACDDAGGARLLEALRATLPAYLVPAAIVRVPALPLTPNGKLDRRALPAPPVASGAAAAVAPRTATEATLAAIVAEVLGLAAVGVHDNFFALGGDSILSIQVVARARAAGVVLTVKQLFLHQTVAALAAVARPARPATAEQGAVVGPVALTPIQHWLLAQPLRAPHHWNQSLLLDVPRDLDRAALTLALQTLVAHHDALRLCVVRDGGGWRQASAPPDRPVALVCHDLVALDARARHGRLEEAATALQAGLDLAAGPLLAAALFDLGEPDGARLLLAVHHLAIDAVSWGIVLEDMWAAYAAVARGEAPALPAKTTSFREWADRLGRHARSAAGRAEAAHWLATVDCRPARLPVDDPGGADVAGTEETLTVTLDAAETAALLGELAERHRARAQDVLLAGLATALARAAGGPTVLVDVEGHGREPLADDLDLTRTVGWFTSLFPVRIEVDASAGPVAALAAAKRALRAVPRGGIGYGCLRWLGDDAALAARLGAVRPEVGFNYLGRLDALLGGAAVQSAGAMRAPDAPRPHALELAVAIGDGALRMVWAYSAARHRRGTVAALAEDVVGALRALRAASQAGARPAWTPDDFPFAGLDDAALARLVPALGGRRIDDVHRLSALQEGMLFHALERPDAGVHVAQLAFTTDAVDPALLRRAGQHVVDHHPALRASILWDGLERPLQVVERDVALVVEEHAGSDEDALLAADRRRGFDLAAAPLFRLTVLHRDDGGCRIVVTHHHVVLDGWSLAVVLHDLLQAYQALGAGTEPALLPAPSPVEHVAWLAARDGRDAERFWRAYLAGFDTPTPLPGRRGRGPTGHREHAQRVPEAVMAALRALARRLRVTPATLLEAAWAICLARHGGGDDVVFGVTVAGRPAELPGIERMVGLLINTRPVRVRLPRAERVGAWLARLHADESAAAAYEWTPLVDVARWSEVPPTTPLFESLVVFENHPADAGLRAGGLAVRDVRACEQTSYPLTLAFAPDGGFRLLYDTSRLDGDAVVGLAERLVTVLRALAASSERTVGSLPALSASEQARLLAWNATAAPVPASCVHARVAAWAERSPRAVALRYGAVEVTYQELRRRTDDLARVLRGAGVGRERVVALYLERSPELVIGMLAVLAAGGAFLPLDPTGPAARTSFILEDAEPALVLTDAAGAVTLPRGHRTLQVDGAAAVVDETHEPRSEPAPDDLAYLIYTSGSTGRPKGVLVPHRGLANLVEPQHGFAPGPGERVLQFASPGFDAAVWEVFLALANGATLCLAPADRLAGTGLLDVLRADAVTTVLLPPALLAVLPPHDLPALATVIAGGERCPASVVARWSPGRRFLNAYGPTEATVCATLAVCEPDGDDPPIGRPLSNTRLYVLDAAGAPVPPGAPGELHIGGVGLARGYHRRPELTAERFVVAAVPDAPGERLYRTGDRVRWRADGQLEFLGRLDDQVKLRGFRIELGEIESALRRQAGVGDAAVVLHDAGGARPCLVAYVAGTLDAEASVRLRRTLAAELPRYMIPEVVVALPALPVTPHGKIDRRALPAPRGEPAPATGVAPRTPTEAAVAAVWCELFARAQVGLGDDFFALGGHSLLATQLVLRLRARLRVEVPVGLVFECPTLAAFAAAVDGLAAGARAAPDPIPRRTSADAPLSFAQERLWFLDRLHPGQATYNVPCALRLHGRLDRGALARTLDALLERHEALRTSFVAGAEGPRQVIAPAGPLRLEVHDLRAVPSAARDATAARLVDQEVSRPFDLGRAPLVRATLLQVGDDEHVLLLVLHHIACDGWSLRLLTAEASVLYAAFARGTDAPLAPLPIAYADFASWQRASSGHERSTRALDYWRAQLAGAPTPRGLPTDRARAAVPSFRGGREPVRIAPAVVAALEALARAEGTTLFTVLLAAFQAFLARMSGDDDVAVGIPVANRTHLATEALVGCFVNTLVVRAPAGGGGTFRELVARVRQRVLEAQAHQDVPFELVVAAVAPARDLARSPLFQVLFAFQEAQPAARALGDLRAERVAVAPAIAKFDLTLELVRGAGGVEGTLDYASDLFDAATVRQLAARFERLLGELAGGPDARLSSVAMLGPDERRTMLVDWNATAESSSDTPVHRLVEAEAARRPEATAVEMDGARLSYAELEVRASRLARQLRALGVGAEARVALYLERSLDLPVAVLAVLQAGAAYVPLDPSYPSARTALVLDDAQPRVVVTQARLRATLPALDCPVVCLDGDGAAIAAIAAPPAVPVLPEQLAYVVYTSGSTGRPKGVLVTHRGLANLARAQAALFELHPGSRVLQFAALGFDAAVSELFATLCAGATLVLAPRERLAPGPDLIDLLRTASITTVTLPPSVLAALPERELAHVTTIVAAGERCPAAVVARWSPGRRLINAYGPTETTVCATLGVVTPEEREPSIGRALPNTALYVLDPHGQPVAVGVPGELYIGGAGVARGYHAQPALTAERFVPVDLPEARGARLYRSGDRVRWRADGTLEFLGRLDEQVKLRGVRIEPGEIVAALRRDADVRDAAVVLHERDAVGAELVAYVVAEPGKGVPAGLAARLARVLPAHMVPSVFVPLAALPLSAHGKLDREALPPPAPRGRTRRCGHEAPRGTLEKTIATTFAAVLGVARVGRHDDFFALGGHSLLAARALSALQAADVDVPLRALFEARTVAALAAMVTAADGARRETIDVAAESVLDPSIRPESPPAVAPDVFLTGATGFVGAFLLAELLATIPGKVHCLVRATSRREASRRVIDNLTRFGLWRPETAARIVALPGDLAAPGFALVPGRWRALTRTLGGVYHAGATVSGVASYGALKAANVGGAHEAIRLAADAGCALHLVSTRSVVAAEAAPGGAYDGLGAGYALTKRVAEGLAQAAVARGLPVVVYRLGRVTGDSRSGRGNPADLLAMVARASLAAGTVPDLTPALDMTPVDYVARAIVRLSQRPSSYGCTFDLTNPRPVSLRRLLRLLSTRGYRLRPTPYARWRDSVVAADPLMAAVLPLRPPPLPARTPDTRATRRALRAAGMASPRIDAGLLARYVAALVPEGKA